MKKVMRATEKVGERGGTTVFSAGEISACFRLQSRSRANKIDGQTTGVGFAHVRPGRQLDTILECRGDDIGLDCFTASLRPTIVPVVSAFRVSEGGKKPSG